MTSTNRSTTDQYGPSTSSNLNGTSQEIHQRLEKLNYDTFIDFIPMILFVTMLIVVGVPGNLLVFLVYLKRFKASATRVFVLAMAVVDLVTNVFTLPRHIVLMRFTYTTHGSTYCQVMGMLTMFPILMSYWILACVAFDRRRRICQPLRRQLSARHATYLLILPFALTAVLLFPFMPFYGEMPFETGVPGLNGSNCELQSSYLGVNVEKMFNVALMIFFIVGFSMGTFAYAHIVYKVCQQNKTHRYFGNQGNGVLSTGEFKMTKVNESIQDTRDSHESLTVETEVKTADTSVDLSFMNERQEVREPGAVNCVNHERNADPERGPTERSSDDPTHSGDEGRESEVSRCGVRTRGAPGGHLKKRLPFSRTTLMMLVLTGVTIVCCVPNIAVS